MSGFNLEDDDVVSLDPDSYEVNKISTATVQELMVRFGRGKSDWAGEGVDCRILQGRGGGWKKGKIRLRLEFVPDEPESPLDDLRSNLKI